MSRTDSGADRSSSEDEETQSRAAEAVRNTMLNSQQSRAETSTPESTRRYQHNSSVRANGHRPKDQLGDFGETSALLLNTGGSQRNYRSFIIGSTPATPRAESSRPFGSTLSLKSQRSIAGSRRSSISKGARAGFGVNSVLFESQDNPTTPLRSAFLDTRTHYDQFTSTDWIRDAIADANRKRELKGRRDWRGRVQAAFDGAQGWILVAFIGCVTAGIAYLIDVSESTLFDYKTGYCASGWWKSKRRCCIGASVCEDWSRWSSLSNHSESSEIWINFAAFVIWVVGLSMLACLVTLATKTSLSSNITLSTLDENLGAVPFNETEDGHKGIVETPQSKNFFKLARSATKTYYPAAGSGVAEVKVILSGFVLHGYLGVRTVVCKSIGLVLSVASGLSIGKEGPYVHIATCIGNISSRMFQKYSQNDAKRREVLSASAASGVAVAFGAPIGGVLFSLEEVSYYFPPKTLFRTFFCCIAAALSLKFLNPYGTGKIVLFEVRYLLDWRFFEIFIFALLGVVGGAAGALFIKASRIWATTFRRIGVIKRSPLTEVFLVALFTGLVSFWNKYTRLPVAELLYELAAPCNSFTPSGTGLCPTQERIPHVIKQLLWAFVVKSVLTIISFGIKVPAGIYVPSMVVGGLVGRIVGHTVQMAIMESPGLANFVGCPVDGNPEACVTPGVYALVAAGATMTGVTRLSVTLAVILFELTGSLEHVLPFSLGVLIAKWTADAMEPASIYDLLTDMNSYPFLDSKVRPVFETELADITMEPGHNDYIDITDSSWVSAVELRRRLQHLHLSGELDGAFPVVRDGILEGLIPAPDLEFALDRLTDEAKTECFMNPRERADRYEDYFGRQTPTFSSQQVDSQIDGGEDEGSGLLQDEQDDSHADLSGYIDAAPVSLDVSSPMDLVFECFVKLGLRYVCVLREGKYAGMVHKKAFVKYVKDVQEGH